MDYKIIDFHAHAFPDKIAQKATLNLKEYYHMEPASEGYFSQLLQTAKAANVSKIVALSTATKPSQVENVNDYLAGLTHQYPDLVIGFGSIHPDYADYKKELGRIKALGLKGIKLHGDFQRFCYDTPKMLPIYEEIVALGLPVLFHMGDRRGDLTTPRRLAWILDRYPNMVAIGAHLGGVFEWDKAEQYLVGRNLYFDTSSTLFELPESKAMHIIEKHGVDKILFGTDYPLADYKSELARFMRLPLSDAQRKKIFYDNACGLLGISS